MRSGGDCRTDMSWAKECRCSRGFISATAFDTNALQSDPDFVGRHCERLTYCAHSSKLAGSPRRCARTSPVKCSEPVIKIGFGLERATASASSTDGVME